MRTVCFIMLALFMVSVGFGLTMQVRKEEAKSEPGAKVDYFEEGIFCQWSPQPVCVSKQDDGRIYGFYIGFCDDGAVIWKPVEVVADGE